MRDTEDSSCLCAARCDTIENIESWHVKQALITDCTRQTNRNERSVAKEIGYTLLNRTLDKKYLETQLSLVGIKFLSVYRLFLFFDRIELNDGKRTRIIIKLIVRSLTLLLFYFFNNLKRETIIINFDVFFDETRKRVREIRLFSFFFFQ